MDIEMRDRFIALETGFNNFKHDHNEEAKVRHAESVKKQDANTTKLDDIYNILSKLPCKVHAGKFGYFESRINWLYVMFGTVVLGGIVLGLWIRSAMAG